MNKTAAVDVAIFGGGIAGLWLLNRLRQAGFSAVLFETDSLGGGQTTKSQGIIHGGMKYALQGVLTSEARAMAGMPGVWRDCLNGQGEINLSAVPVLSQHQYLWSPHKFTSKLTGFLAGATLTSKVDTVPKDQYPSIFRDAGFRGEVYSLDEIVLDVPAVVRELVKSNQDAIFKIDLLDEEDLHLDEEGNLVSVTVRARDNELTVSAQQFAFTAGAGNELIIKKLKQKDLAMQRRPLHMVMMCAPFSHALYAHCLGLGTRPRLTITTHYLHDGRAVWYLGGQIAEDGVKRTPEAQIKAARTELTALFPWIDFSAAEFATFMVDRAEPLQKGGMKPETSFVKAINNVIVAWPTKLALAPKLADEIMQTLLASQVVPQLFDTRELRTWPMPAIAAPMWEEVFCKSVV